MKKGKNVSISINVFNLIDEVANPEYLMRFVNSPENLALVI
jgi:hypothetical protein